MNIVTNKILGKWTEYTISNDHGISVSALDFGGIITKIMAPDKNGKLENIVLGYKDYQDYESNPHILVPLLVVLQAESKELPLNLMAEHITLKQTTGKTICMADREAFTKSSGRSFPLKRILRLV